MTVKLAVLSLLVVIRLGMSREQQEGVELGVVSTYHHPIHSHQSVLDHNSIFTVYWTPDFIKQEVVFEIHARTKGWIGFGFSLDGGMRGSDIMMAWVKDGRLFLQDYYGVGEGTPLLDDHADWRPLYARENDTHTILVVVRDFNTCDPQDYVLTNDSMRMIYAWGEEDPQGNVPSYHGHRRGNRYALVLLPFHRQLLAEESQVWRVEQSVTLPHTQDTFYWCHIEKIPKWETKHHYIGVNIPRTR